MTIRAFHCQTNKGRWYSKYQIDSGIFFCKNRRQCSFDDFDTCNLVYTTEHDRLIDAEKYKPSMLKFNERQNNAPNI